MAKYKVGDKVRVKKYPVEIHGFLLWIESMNKMLGKVATINRVFDDGTYDIEEMDCRWHDSMFEGLANSTGNELIDLLMKKLGVDVDEEFEVKGSSFNPFHFNKQGKLVDCDFDERQNILFEIIYEEREIKNIHKTEVKEMTMEQLQEALGYPVKIVKGGE